MSPNAAYDDEKMFFLYLDNAYKDFASYCRKKGVSATEVFDVEGHGDTVDNNARSLLNSFFNIISFVLWIMFVQFKFFCFHTSTSDNVESGEVLQYGIFYVPAF